MSSKIGVYFDAANIGGGLDVEALAAGVKAKWESLVAVVRVFPVLADQAQSIAKDIEDNGLDGVLICGASPRQDVEIYRFPVLTERVNLREQCVLSYEDPLGNGLVPGQPAPELLVQIATDYINMGVVKLQKGSLPDSAALEKGVRRILVVGGGFTGLTAAAEAAASGYEVVLVEKTDRLGGAVNNIPTGSPLQGPWEDKESTNLAERIAAVEKNPKITVYMSSTVAKLAGQPGQYTLTLNTPEGEKTLEVGSAVVAAGWTPLDPKYMEAMGLGVSPKVMHAAEFGKQFLAGKITARRIAFVLDTTLAEEAAARQKAEAEAQAAEQAAEAAPAEAPAEGEEAAFVKQDLESIEHLRYSNAVNSVGMLRLANSVCEKTNDVTQCYVLYKDMVVPGILERFYRKMQDRLGLMMTKADVTSIREQGDHMVVSCENTLLGMDFDLDCDLVVVPTGLVPVSAKEAIMQFEYRQGPDFPDLDLFDGYLDSNYICFPYETRRTGVYAAGCVRQPMTLDGCLQDARGAVLKAIQAIECAEHGVAVHPRSGDRTYPVFNFVRCTQCKRCTEECPFGALDDDEKGTPKPNPARCRRCGTCFGACPERVISFANYNIDQIGSMIREVSVPKDFKNEGPRILILACENDAYPALDMAALQGHTWSPYVRIIPVRCLGSVNAIWVSDAMSKGYDGVMLLGCKYGDDYQCHFVKGSELCARRMTNIAETLNRLGVEPERVEQFELAIDEAHCVTDMIDGFVKRIEQMGPNPFKAM